MIPAATDSARASRSALAWSESWAFFPLRDLSRSTAVKLAAPVFQMAASESEAGFVAPEDADSPAGMAGTEGLAGFGVSVGLVCAGDLGAAPQLPS